MIRKISHIAIAILLLVLTMGFSISKHYCGNSMVDVAVFSQGADGCGMDMKDMNMPANTTKDACMTASSCCHTDLHVYQLDKTYTSPVVIGHVPFIQVDLAVLDLSLFTSEIREAKTNNYFILAKSPPPKDVLSALSDLQIYRL
ncbi:MAG TPA: hypothetical protein VKA27_07890 [Sunxiuqinia sp.]|nr:hypothetical protein [Sunxiuqinia sp.]